MNQKLVVFKKHFVVEKLPITSNIKDVEDAFDSYFGIYPPFEDIEKKIKEFPDVFILSVLDQYHDNNKERIAIISNNSGFKTASRKRNYIAHLYKLEDKALFIIYLLLGL